MKRNKVQLVLTLFFLVAVYAHCGQEKKPRAKKSLTVLEAKPVEQGGNALLKKTAGVLVFPKGIGP